MTEGEFSYPETSEIDKFATFASLYTKPFQILAEKYSKTEQV